MVEDVDMESLSLNDCKDVSFDDARFKQSDNYKVVHGDEVCELLPFMYMYD
jgi:hypothetical protein